GRRRVVGRGRGRRGRRGQRRRSDRLVRRPLWISLIAIVGLAVVALGATIAAGNSPLLGLDLQGGLSVVLQPEKKVDSGVLNTSISIIRARVDALGVAEPDI